MTNHISDPTSSASPLDLTPDVLAFSGSRHTLNGYGLRLLHDDLDAIGLDATGYASGGCTGIDFYVGRYCYERWPSRQHIVVLPANRSRIGVWWRHLPDVVVIEMPPGSSYRDRNQYLVNISRRLSAYPFAAEANPSQQRSGTWQAYRMAQRSHRIPPRHRLLDGWYRP